MQQVVTPEHYGLARVRADDAPGGTAEENAEIVRAMLSGKAGPQARHRAAQRRLRAPRSRPSHGWLGACLDAARESIDSGAALAKLDALVASSNDYATAAA